MSTLKILIATVPADGHFNPLTGVARYLKDQGHDVRWYTGPGYADRVGRLGLPFFPYRQARNITQDNLNEVFPERLAIKGALARIKFDIRHLFLGNVPAYLRDVEAIQRSFDFDVLLCDPGFLACHLIQEKLRKPAVVFGVAPLHESSRDLPPPTMGLTPGRGALGRLRDALLRAVFPRLIFGESSNLYNEILTDHGLPPVEDTLLDVVIRRTTRYLQSGVPGFEYPRSDVHPHVRFVGPLLPHKKGASPAFAHARRARHFEKVILVSQGTVDNKDPEKLVVPTLEAFKDQPYLLLVATGGMHTAALRERFPQSNVIIDDFMDYDATLPHVDLFVSSGGYGSVLLGLSHGVPLLVAGKHEGKNEIVARVGYFKLGVNLGTERPRSAQIERGAREIWANPVYAQNLVRLRREFADYNPNALSEKYIEEAVRTFEINRRVLA